MHKNCAFTLAGTGVVFIFLGIFMAWYGVPKIVEMQIKKSISLNNGTPVYDKFWKNPPLPLNFKIFFFNVENPEEIQQGAKPRLREVGPYVYKQYHFKTILSVDEEADTITYSEHKIYKFDKTLSGCRSEDDEITILNAGLVGTALMVESMIPGALGTVNDAIPYLYSNPKNVFITAKVRDVAFDGIKVDCSDDEVEFMCGALRGNSPVTVRVHPNDQDYLFSLFHHTNDTMEGPFVVGKGDTSERGRIYKWKNDSVLDVWSGPECNMINGTDSYMFMPVTKQDKKIYIFTHDICSSSSLTLENEVTVLGIKALRYSSTPDTFGKLYCFCPRIGVEIQTNCVPSGLMSIGDCIKAPTILSHPHFLYADPKVLDLVEGLHPNKEEHELVVDIVPRLGLPLRGYKRVQFNLHLKRMPSINLLANVSEAYFPLMWMEEGLEITDEFLPLISRPVYLIELSSYLKWSLITLGFILIIISSIVHTQQEQMLCFGLSKSRQVDDGTSAMQMRSQSNNNNAGPANQYDASKSGGGKGRDYNNSDSSFDSSLQYAALYPQLTNRNVNDGLGRRHNTDHEHNHEWQPRDFHF